MVNIGGKNKLETILRLKIYFTGLDENDVFLDLKCNAVSRYFE